MSRVPSGVNDGTTGQFDGPGRGAPMACSVSRFPHPRKDCHEGPDRATKV